MGPTFVKIDKLSGAQLAILSPLVSLATLGIMFFSPALAAMSVHFHITEGQVQMTQLLYLIGYGVGQIPYGPLSNRIGRKSTIYLGCVIASLGCFLCLIAAWTTSYWLILLGRFITALGASVGLSMGFAILGDVYSVGKKSAKYMSMMFVGFGLIPSIGLLVSGGLVHGWGWESVIYAFLIYALFVMVLSMFLPQTVPEPLQMKKQKGPSILKTFKNTLKVPQLLIGALLVGGANSYTNFFGTKAAFIGIHLIGMNAFEFGLYSMFSLLGMVVGALLSIFLVKIMSRHLLIYIGVGILLIASAFMFFAFLDNWINVWTFFAPMFFIWIGVPLVFANASALGMHFVRNKSDGSSILNAVNLMISIVGVIVFINVDPSGGFIFPLIFLITGFLLVGLCFIFRILTSESPEKTKHHFQVAA